MKPDTWSEARKAISEAIRQASETVAVVRETPRRHVDERLVQCIWFDRLLRRAGLQTASGKALEIIDPGRWNTGAGPDFLGATIRLAGEERRGDVEIHVESVEWRNHTHHHDIAYNNCLLHAFLWASDDRPYDELHDGRRLERFEMGPALEPDIETLRRTVAVEEYPYGRPSALGVCHPQMIGLDEEFIGRLLDLAGRERMEAKIRRLSDQLAGESFDQVFYQALMTSQGHKASKTLYFLLSKRARLAELYDHTRGLADAERACAIQSILMAVGGLGNGGGDTMGKGADDAEDSGDPPDTATQEYRAECARVWREAAPFFSDRLIPATRRWWKGVRPANFPPRRLAGVAHLLTRLAGKHGPTRTLMARLRGLADCPPESPREIREAVAALTRFLAVDEPDDYWSRHYTLGGKPSGRSLALVGESSARSLVFNVVLPLGLVWARRENDERLESALSAFARRFPPLSDNEVTEFMEKRLFGDDSRAARLLKTEIRRQGLFHIFADCCNNNERTCAECLLLTLGNDARASAG